MLRTFSTTLYRPKYRHFVMAMSLCSIFALGACAPEQKVDDYVEEPIASLYEKAMQNMTEQDYKLAAKSFEEVERQHPYSAWAVKAQIMTAYAYYKAEKYQDAIIAAERFVELYPANKDVPYAYYIRAISYYEQISDVARDQKMTLLARSSLQEIIKRFPKSEYARDARLKLDLTTDHLAGKEVDIGRYYQRKGDWLAAINRFQLVAKNYQTTSHAAEALYRLVEVYTQIGLTDQAEKAGSVLGYNYPGSDWYKMAYAILKPGEALPDQTNAEKSWTDDIWPF